MRSCVHAQIIPNFYHSALEAKSWNEQRCSGICKHWRTEDLQCWKLKNLCQESEAEFCVQQWSLRIGITLCIGVTNYLPRGPKSGGQEILLLSRTRVTGKAKHSTKKESTHYNEILITFFGFWLLWFVIFLLLSLFVSGISERRWRKATILEFFDACNTRRREVVCFHENSWEAVTKSGNIEQITTEIFQSSN